MGTPASSPTGDRATGCLFSGDRAPTPNLVFFLWAGWVGVLLRHSPNGRVGVHFVFFARAGRVGVGTLSSKTGWAWVGARARPGTPGPVGGPAAQLDCALPPTPSLENAIAFPTHTGGNPSFHTGLKVPKLEGYQVEIKSKEAQTKKLIRCTCPTSGHGRDDSGPKWHAPLRSESAAQKKSFRPQRRGLQRSLSGDPEEESPISEQLRDILNSKSRSVRSVILQPCKPIKCRRFPTVGTTRSLFLTARFMRSFLPHALLRGLKNLTLPLLLTIYFYEVLAAF